MKRIFWGILCMLAASSVRLSAAEAVEIPLYHKVNARLATIEQGRAAISRHDDYTAALGPFDLQAKPQSDKPLSLDEFLKHAAAQVVEWEPEDAKKIADTLAELKPRLEKLSLKLPKEILFVQTTGKEEGNAAYTRGNAIYLPRSNMKKPFGEFKYLIAHELFHAISRNDPAMRDKLYAIVGFFPCPPLKLPVELAKRTIANPDAPKYIHAIEVKREDTAVLAVPILLATKPYDGEKKGVFFPYMSFKLLVIGEHRGGMLVTESEPVLKDGEPILLEPRGLKSYADQIGRNTGYIIHPEEIMAENFSHLVWNTPGLPTPKIIEEMKKVLSVK